MNNANIMILLKHGDFFSIFFKFLVENYYSSLTTILSLHFSPRRLEIRS